MIGIPPSLGVIPEPVALASGVLAVIAYKYDALCPELVGKVHGLKAAIGAVVYQPVSRVEPVLSDSLHIA
jgi:hypothetical protein